MLKGIKIRIYPNIEQTNYLNCLLGCTRLVYNTALDWKKSAYETNKTNISSTELSHKITELKNDKIFLREVHSKVLQQALMDLNNAFNNFFRNVKQGKTPGYPQFKKKNMHKDSCRFPIDAFIGIYGNRISLIKKLNDILFKCSKRDERYLNKKQKYVHSVTVSKTADGKYYASVLIDFTPENKKRTSNSVGIDLGIKHLVITSDGEFFDNIDNSYNEKRIKHYQKELSKKVKDSKRREKIRIKLAKQHAKLSNRRKWLLHQITTYLVNENQVICMEDLNVSGMVKNHNLAKSVENSSFGEIKRMLQYKCEWYGRELIQVGRFYPSSKTCNVCGYINKKLSLSDREWICPECGTKHNRDTNAAMNILSEGERIIGLSSPEFTHKERPTVDDHSAMNLKSSVSMRCEKKVFQ